MHTRSLPDLARLAPVITDRGKPAHVLLSFAAYQRLIKQRRNITDALAMPDMVDIEFDPPRATIESRSADFS